MSGQNGGDNIEDLDRLRREIGQRLRKARVGRPMSLKKMSSAMNLSYQSVWKYEEGISDIPLSRLLKYCQIVRISFDKIFAGLGSTIVLETASQSAETLPTDPVNEKSKFRDRLDRRG